MPPIFAAEKAAVSLLKQSYEQISDMELGYLKTIQRDSAVALIIKGHTRMNALQQKKKVTSDLVFFFMCLNLHVVSLQCPGVGF